MVVTAHLGNVIPINPSAETHARATQRQHKKCRLDRKPNQGNASPQHHAVSSAGSIMVVEQVHTHFASAESIMRRPLFVRGLDDIRNGRPFDDGIAWEDGHWDYERGRLFGCIAPRSMALFVGGKLNPKAVTLFVAACERRLIR
jgi:hypothetical protein